MKRQIAAGILAIDKETGKILMILRSNLCPQPYTWSNVGGKMDPDDENPKTTAIREFKEEVNPDDPYLISKMPFFINEDKFLKFYTYLALFEKKFVPALNEENIDYGWFDLDDLPDNIMPACGFLIEKKYQDIKKIINKVKKDGRLSIQPKGESSSSVKPLGKVESDLGDVTL